MTKMPELPEPAAHLADYSPVFSESQLLRYAKQYGRDLLEEAAKIVSNPLDYTRSEAVEAIRAMKEPTT